jgi:ABC-type Na+ efflux pump permease subunit
MRGFLVGLLVLLVVLGGGFAVLVMMAEAGAPERAEIRIEVSDELHGTD